MTDIKQKYPHIHNAGLLNGGWDWLLIKLYSYIHNLQESYVKLLPKPENLSPYDEVPGPAFFVTIDQIKEKFSRLRIYVTIRPAQLDWSIFDQKSYNKEFERWRSEIYGFISAIESISGSICEISGERGSQRNINGWYRTLSDTEYAKINPAQVE